MRPKCTTKITYQWLQRSDSTRQQWGTQKEEVKDRSEGHGTNSEEMGLKKVRFPRYVITMDMDLIRPQEFGGQREKMRELSELLRSRRKDWNEMRMGVKRKENRRNKDTPKSMPEFNDREDCRKRIEKHEWEK